MIEYLPRNNTIEYVKTIYKNANLFTIIKSIQKTVLSHNNSFKFDKIFYKNAYNLDFRINYYTHYSNTGIYQGDIVSIGQLENILNRDINLFINDNNQICLFDKNQNLILLSDFINNEIKSLTFDYLINNIVVESIFLEKKIYNMIYLIYIGDYKVGEFVLKKIIEKNNQKDVNLVICFRNISYFKYLNKYLNFINNKIIMYLKYEPGNDIIPTLMMHNAIKNLGFSCKYYCKIHTKSDVVWLNNCLSYLLNKDNEDIILNKLEYLNSVTHSDYMKNIRNDPFNIQFILKHKKELNLSSNFCGGSIYTCNANLYDLLINFIKENSYQAYFFQTYYDNNTINTNTPIHFLERLTGYIKNEEIEKKVNIFNWISYIESNPDLFEHGINNKAMALNHYITSGIGERRIYTGKVNFNFENYIKKNKDLENIITDIDNAFVHYMQFGIKELRDF